MRGSNLLAGTTSLPSSALQRSSDFPIRTVCGWGNELGGETLDIEWNPDEWPNFRTALRYAGRRKALTIVSSDRGAVFGEPRREWMICINQLRWMLAHPRVAQTHR